MKLIGLAGEYGWGKDAVFEIIDAETQRTGRLTLRKAFADDLKISALKSLGMISEEYARQDYIALANSLKQSGRLTVTWVDHKDRLRSHVITGRQFWQNYGTEGHRTNDLGFSFSENFWIDNLLPFGEVPYLYTGTDGWDDPKSRPKWWDSFKEGWAGFADYALVTDVRYPNEAQRVLDLGGEVWLVDASQRVGYNGDGHSSEDGLPPELITRTVDNNGSLEDLEVNVYVALDDADG